MLDEKSIIDDWSPVKEHTPAKEMQPVKGFTKILAKSDDFFYVKGPMGKGLQIEDRGVHVAFCAGTGVLVFLDLVGHLIIRNSLPFVKYNSQKRGDLSLNIRSDFSTANPRHFSQQFTATAPSENGTARAE